MYIIKVREVGIPETLLRLGKRVSISQTSATSLIFHHYFFLLIMRKVEAKMCEAIRNRKDWCQSNTQVSYNDLTKCSQIFLHGHKIATYDYNTKAVLLSSCGYETVTTKSRLNAILHEVKYGASVYQRNWNWFVSFKQLTIDFFDGIVLHDTPELSYS